jgi:hypothetical protein
MINLTHEGKLRELGASIRLHLTLERAAAEKLSKEMTRYAKEASTHPLDESIDAKHKANLTSILLAIYKSTMGLFAKRLLVAANKPKNLLPQTLEIKVTEAEILASQREFISETVAQKVKDISRTSREMVRAAVRKATADGLGERATAKLIREKIGSSIGYNRSMTIARTEVHGASQAGSMFAAESLGVVTKKEWVSAEDERTREAHAKANGQKAVLNGSFKVGGEDLNFPGDPSGSPENVINCRCVMVYDTD